jgi:hypothetical protein
MFIRYLIKNSKRLTVYLTADKCEKSVQDAIQGKLKGLAKDVNFLNSMLFIGAIDICIDGLNEVSPGTRANITKL